MAPSAGHSGECDDQEMVYHHQLLLLLLLMMLPFGPVIGNEPVLCAEGC
jgi:hypothetical protein